MPTPVRIFAENQPVTAIVNTIRAPLNNQSVGSNIWIALAWCLGITIVAYLLAMRLIENVFWGIKINFQNLIAFPNSCLKYYPCISKNHIFHFLHCFLLLKLYQKRLIKMIIDT